MYRRVTLLVVGLVLVVATPALADAHSKTNREIAVSREGGTVILDLETKESRVIGTLVGHVIKGLAFSPDGQQAVFGAYKDHQWRVRVGELNGPSRIIGGEFERDRVVELAWSPTGAHIAVQTDGHTVGTGGVYLIDVENEQAMRRLTPKDGVDESPAWSPDGTQLAVAAMTEQSVETYADMIWVERKSEIDLIDPVFETRQRITDLNGRVTAIHWSPDGTMLAFLLGRELYVVNADGTKPRKLLAGIRPGARPRWSSDNAKILIDISSESSIAYADQPARPAQPLLAVFNLETGRSHTFRSPVYIWNYEFGPRGKTALVTGDKALWSVDVRTGASSKVMSEAAFWAELVYLPVK